MLLLSVGIFEGQSREESGQRGHCMRAFECPEGLVFEEARHKTSCGPIPHLVPYS